MLGDIVDHCAQPFAFVITGTLLMDLAKSPFDWLFIMHLQGVGSHNHSASGVQDSR
jgi:hypothetical protein